MSKLKGSSVGAPSLQEILGNRVSRVNNIYYRIANSYMRAPQLQGGKNINVVGSQLKGSASLADLSKAPPIAPMKHSNLAMYQKKPRYLAGSILTSQITPKVKGLAASPSLQELSPSQMIQGKNGRMYPGGLVHEAQNSYIAKSVRAIHHDKNE